MKGNMSSQPMTDKGIESRSRTRKKRRGKGERRELGGKETLELTFRISKAASVPFDTQSPQVTFLTPKSLIESCCSLLESRQVFFSLRATKRRSSVTGSIRRRVHLSRVPFFHEERNLLDLKINPLIHLITYLTLSALSQQTTTNETKRPPLDSHPSQPPRDPSSSSSLRLPNLPDHQPPVHSTRTDPDHIPRLPINLVRLNLRDRVLMNRSQLGRSSSRSSSSSSSVPTSVPTPNSTSTSGISRPEGVERLGVESTDSRGSRRFEDACFG